MLNTTSIKNLSIAYEALSHASGVEDLQQRIRKLLEMEIYRAEERAAQRAAPTITTDDDTPF